jgi:septum formation protein
LLSEAGFEFEVQVRPTTEEWPLDLAANEVAEFLAAQKAQAWNKEELTEGQAVLTADTTVVLGDEILNKPSDAAEAQSMLEALSGKSHAVITGIAIQTKAGLISLSETTWVDFRPLTDEEITAYISTGHPFDKAGAYGIQDGFGMAAITGIRGCYYNVMGLPIARLYPFLKQLGF